MRFAGEERDVQARIAGGGTRGVLQLSIDGGRWDAVCDDSFSTREAEAFCAMLGFGDNVGTQFNTTHGDDIFAAANISCYGGACVTSREPYTDGCGDDETVGLDCSGSISAVEAAAAVAPANASAVGFDTCGGCGDALGLLLRANLLLVVRLPPLRLRLRHRLCLPFGCCRLRCSALVQVRCRLHLPVDASEPA